MSIAPVVGLPYNHHLDHCDRISLPYHLELLETVHIHHGQIFLVHNLQVLNYIRYHLQLIRVFLPIGFKGARSKTQESLPFLSAPDF